MPLTATAKRKIERALVILPTYNEADSLIKVVDAVLSLPENLDILVVDDSSPDGTADLAKIIRVLKNGFFYCYGLANRVLPPLTKKAFNGD